MPEIHDKIVLMLMHKLGVKEIEFTNDDLAAAADGRRFVEVEYTICESENKVRVNINDLKDA